MWLAPELGGTFTFDIRRTGALESPDGSGARAPLARASGSNFRTAFGGGDTWAACWRQRKRKRKRRPRAAAGDEHESLVMSAGGAVGAVGAVGALWRPLADSGRGTNSGPVLAQFRRPLGSQPPRRFPLNAHCFLSNARRSLSAVQCSLLAFGPVSLAAPEY